MTNPFAKAHADIFNKLKEAGDSELVDAVFQPATGDSIPLVVWLYKEDDYQVSEFEGQVFEELTLIEYLLADINRDVVEDETFTIGGDVYVVESVKSRDDVSRKALVV